MFESLLNQPQLIELTYGSQLKLSLRDQISDISLLQTLGGHIAEWVVVDTNSRSVTLVARTHPFLQIENQSQLTIVEQSQEFVQHEIIRTHGQGVRLFGSLGFSPSICIGLLRQGLFISIDSKQAGEVSFSPRFDNKWQLIELENDLRLFSEPNEMHRAKALLARKLDYELKPEAYLLDISEIEIVSRELNQFAGNHSVHHFSGIVGELSTIESQLHRRKQLLIRLYQQLLERPNWQYSSNSADDFDSIKRKLESYQLLAPPELNAMVEQMFIDDLD
ncbi:hypothetical protein [Shewanella sp. Isolate11]|uniref:hypothetical protein n=1 Tax=Shewanella sp. Isolate11 TaxID=2908530 RepID=UPI001EFE0D86|nr:hypothetical protein [Shewanella sp. Isolate11]MCG9696966.1 hypothetical protein [Shewanella sp. Isolate11]